MQAPSARLLIYQEQKAIYRTSILLSLLSMLSPIVCNAAKLQSWLLTPAEYKAASGLASEKSGPCDIAFALNVTTSLECKGDAKKYGAQIKREFRLAQTALAGSNFTIRDYEAVWASNYPSDHSEPSYTFAACAISFRETYVGDPSDLDLLSPTNLICNRSMVAHGKQMINLFEDTTKAELLQK